MTPFEWIIALAIIWWVIRGGLSDLVLAMRGITPPRVAEGRARAAAGGRRYGLRGYASDLWSDAWKVARARREARVQQRLEHIREHGPGPTWRQRASERWSAAWGRWETRMAQRWQDRREREGRPAPEPVAPTTDRDRPGGTQDRDQEPRGDQEDERRREPVEPVTVTPWHPDRDRPEPQELTARPGPGGRWEVVDAPEATEPNPKGRDDRMAEVTGLVSALAHATEMRRAFEESTAGAEQYLAGLEAGGVKGPALEAVQQAMEAQQAAAASWAQAEATLQRHMAVREAYEANQDAGHREFVTAE